MVVGIPVVGPVSYTHLDVYKRQYIIYAKNWIVPRWGNLPLEQVKTVEVERWLRAVSYTHLDVYKRQSLKCGKAFCNLFP